MPLERWLSILRLRVRSLVRGGALDRELDEELQDHLEHLVAANVEAGMTADRARRAARLAMGIEAQKEACRDARGVRPFEEWLRDVQYAWRVSMKDRVTTIVAVLSLALAIGANTAIFSIVDGLLLRPLPVRDPSSLALVTHASGGYFPRWSGAVWTEIARRRSMFDDVAAWASVRFDLASGGESQPADGLWVSGSYFRALGVTAAIGRTLTPADDPGSGDGPVAVISHRFWIERFAGSPDVIGRAVTLGGIAFTIVGVTPAGFLGADVGRSFDVAVPLGDEPLVDRRDSWLDSRADNRIAILVRLKGAQSAAEATTALRGSQAAILRATVPLNFPKRFADGYLRDGFIVTPSAGGNAMIARPYERPLAAIMVVAALVLFIACANVAHLLLARAGARQHELGVRRALGASRGRLVRQLLTESGLLAAAGASLGLAIGAWGSRLIVASLSTDTNPIVLDLSLDRRVLAFTVGLTVLTTLLFGSAPAWRGSGVAPMDALNDREWRFSIGRRAGASAGLLVTQVALSLMLVVAAGLFTRTFARLEGRALGFDPDGVLVASVDASRASHRVDGRIDLFERTLAAARAVPGVADAAISLATPVSASGQVLAQPIEAVSGRELPTGPRDRISALNLVLPGWFRAMRMPMRAGRDVSEADRKGTPPVAVVNEAFARRFLGGENPVGHTMTILLATPKPMQVEIVGLVADAVYGSLRYPIRATMYLSIAQLAGLPVPPSFLSYASLSVRTAGGSPRLLEPSLTSAITGVQPELTMTFHTLAGQVDQSLVQDRVVAALSGIFGGLALLLAAVGLYGVTAYGVSQRRIELGIRMALGAGPAQVRRLVLGRAIALVALGVLAGTALSMWAARFVTSLLYDVAPRDPATLVFAALVLGATGTFAAWLPARRAARTDPANVLRDL